MATKFNQCQFRNAVSLRDKCCLITRFNECECDACHIIPAYICEKYQLPFQYDRKNGLLLTKSLHVSFDHFLWTFDIYDIIFKDNRYYCKILISPGHKNLTICNYRDQYICIPTELFPFLYVHYQVFVSVNYTLFKDTNKLYYQILHNDRIFSYLYNYGAPMTEIAKNQFRNFLIEKKIISMLDKNEYDINAIIKHKVLSSDNKYLIWWNYYPYTKCTWEPIENISQIHLDAYHNYQEELADKSW